jgi:cytochrome c oxidase assembly factor CtaG
VGGRLAIDPQLRVEHHGFPRTLGALVRREAWHGMGDFSSLSVFMRSKVALNTVAFVLLHMLLLVSLVTSWVPGKVAAAAGILSICLASSYWKYGHLPVHAILHNTVIFWFYYLGRAFAMVPWVARMNSNRAR